MGERCRERVVVGRRLEETEVEGDHPRRGRQQVFDDLSVIAAWIPAVVGAQLGDRAFVDGHDRDEAARVRAALMPSEPRMVSAGCDRKRRSWAASSSAASGLLAIPVSSRADAAAPTSNAVSSAVRLRYSL